MAVMRIRSGGSVGRQSAYAAGRFGAGDGYVISQSVGESPFGSFICGMGCDYAVEISPDGAGCSRLDAFPVTKSNGLGKAFYLRDRESGEVWSGFHGPVRANTAEYEVTFSPGQVTAYSLKNKIACRLTIATPPGLPCEIWLVRLENRSAAERNIAFTTFVEPRASSVLETKFLDREKAIVMRPPLESIGTGRMENVTRDLVFFHAGTLVPIRRETEKSEFVGEGRSLQNPRHLESDRETGRDGSSNEPIASFTVEIELPIDGEAEFGFCFGATDTAEKALEIVRGLAKTSDLVKAVDDSRAHWREVCSPLQVSTPDSGLNALVNTWLPYEAYAVYVKEQSGAECLDPARAMDVLKSLAPLCAGAPGACRNALLSFAGQLSIRGIYCPYSESLVALPPRELLWLAAAVAGYAAETGDSGVLSESIPLKDGPSLTLGQHCERAIRMCLTSAGAQDDEPRDHLLEQTVRQWSFIGGSSEEFTAQLDTLKARKLSERTEHLEQRSLPRRVSYFQSTCPTLAYKEVARILERRLGSEAASASDAVIASAVYSALVEEVFGLVPTYEGLTLSPRLPDSWFECEATRRFRGDTYKISFTRSALEGGNAASIVVDGEPVLGNMLPHFGDGAEHEVDVTF